MSHWPSSYTRGLAWHDLHSASYCPARGFCAVATQVLYTRMIAEIVGGEKIWSGGSYPILGLLTIYKNEGLAGLFG